MPVLSMVRVAGDMNLCDSLTCWAALGVLVYIYIRKQRIITTEDNSLDAYLVRRPAWQCVVATFMCMYLLYVILYAVLVVGVLPFKGGGVQ